MTAAERLLYLSKATGAAGALLLMIGQGPTAEAALLDYSALESVTAAEHLLYEKAFGGGIGHGKKKRWIEREGKILVFDTAEQVESYIALSDKKPVVSVVKHGVEERPKEVTPTAVIDKLEISRLSKAYNYQQKLYDADRSGDIALIVSIYCELQRREEDDIEILLMAI